MTSHPYLYEKLIAIHQAELQHDMQQCRIPDHFGQQRTLVQSTANNLGTLLIALGSQLQRTGQRREASLRNS